MSNTTETIKERIAIVDLVGSYIKLERAGSSFKARCPFHNEKTPSFFVSPERGGYYCFGCNAKGDIFTFVQEFEGLDFKGALKVLAERAGVPLTYNGVSSSDGRDRLFEVMEVACRFFESLLVKNAFAKDYLSSRGLTLQTIADFRLGVAPHDWRVLVDHLSRAGFSDKELLAAGLAKDGPKGIYDTFRARVMFPIADSSGRVIAFSGRTLESDAPIAKYLNSPETALFSKSKVLYGLDRAKKTIRLSDQAVLVEGQMDLLMAHQAGTQNAVASSGTALTRDHLELIGRLTRRLVLAFDADGAGVSAALRSATMALSMGFEVRVAGLPPGEDPASLIISRPDVWHAAIKDALPLIDFYLARVMSGKADLRVRGRLIAKDVLPYVAVLDSSIEQSHYIKKISDILGVREESAWEDLAKVPREIDLVSNNQTIGKDSSVSSLKTSARKSLIGKKLLGIMYWRGSLSPPDSVSKDIARRLTEIIGSKRFTEIDDFYQKKRADLILEAELSFSESQPLSKSVAELFREFEKEFLQDELRVKMDELSLAEREKNHDRAFSILKQCQTISSKINALASMNI